MLILFRFAWGLRNTRKTQRTISRGREIKSDLGSFFFEVIDDIVRIGTFPYIKHGRYFVLYSEIVETGPLKTFGLAPISAHALESSGMFMRQRNEALAYTNKFIGACQIEMVGQSQPSGMGLSPYICNGFIGSLEGCCLIDKHDSATFEYPPPLPGKDADSIDFLRSKIDSETWFLSPSNDRCLLKCCRYPFLCDLHGNPIELKSRTDCFYVVVQCIRPKLCVCPFCGKGLNGEFSSPAINETMTKDEILNLGVKNQEEVQAIGSLKLQEHLKSCPIASKMASSAAWNWKEGTCPPETFCCYACQKKFNNEMEWFNHCKQRICIVNTINFLLHCSKRKRSDTDSSGKGGLKSDKHDPLLNKNINDDEAATEGSMGKNKRQRK